MQKIKTRLMLSKEDYKIIMSYIKTGVPTITFNRQDAEELEGELKKAKLVNKNELPDDVVRLNSTVVIKEETGNKII
jgi:regulator of nucleoside diphosphate kinase